MSFVAASADADVWVMMGAVLVPAIGLGVHAIRGERRRLKEMHSISAMAAADADPSEEHAPHDPPAPDSERV